MKTLVMFMLVSLFCTSFSAQAANPRRKLTITMANYILQGQIGQEIHRSVIDLYPFFDYRFGCTVEDIEQMPCPHKKTFASLENILIIHPELFTASNEYLSWIMVQGMVKMVLSKRYQLERFPRVQVVEIEQMVMLTAQRYWNELNPVLTNDIDLFSTSANNIGYHLDLSVLSFTRAYNQNPRVNFYNKVALRATRYDGIYLSVSDIIESPNFSKEEKEVAHDILIDFEHAL